jgi:hypothetical protein
MFDEGVGDKAIFVRLKNSKKIIPGEINIVVILPKRMKKLKGQNKIISAVAEAVIDNLPGQPQRGVTIIRRVVGLSADVSQGTEQGKFNAEIKFSAEVSAFFEF